MNRVLPNRQHRTVGSWCFVDLEGPGQVGDDASLDVGPHSSTTPLPQIEVGNAVATVLVGQFIDALSPARRDTEHVGVDLAMRTGDRPALIANAHSDWSNASAGFGTVATPVARTDTAGPPWATGAL